MPVVFLILLGLLVAGVIFLPKATHAKKRAVAKKAGWLGAIITFIVTSYLTLTDKDSTAAIGLITLVPFLSAAIGLVFFWGAYVFSVSRNK
jgi:hypothetical protein